MSLAPDGYVPTTRERLSLFRRLRPSFNEQQHTNFFALQASGVNVDLSSEGAIQATLRNRQQWQSQVWDARDACGEVWNAVDTVGKLLSRVVIYAAEVPDEADQIPEATTDPKAIATVKRLGNRLDVGAKFGMMGRQKLLPGEFHLVGIAKGADRPNKKEEEWIVVSNDEIKGDGPRAIVEHPSGVNIALDATRGDTWIRIWTPHPRKQRLADSPLRPLLNNIDELVWWDAAAASVAMSRAAMAGFLGIPQNLEAPLEAGDDPRATPNERFVTRVFRNIIRAIKEPRSPSAAAPFVFTYPPNDSGKSGLEFIVPERPQDDLLEKRTDRNLRRIAQGFPLPVEAFFGLGEATHWGAGQIERSKFHENVEPFVLDLLTDLTRHWFRPIIAKLGLDPNKYLLWYDATSIIVQSNPEEQSNKGFEYGLIKEGTWRRINGYSDHDAPSDDEKQETLDWIRALRGREGNGEDNPSDEPEDQTNTPREPKPGASHPPAKKNSVATRGKGQPVMSSAHSNGHDPNHLGRQLASIDADLMSRLQVMCSEQTRSALVKAGNFLRNRARKNPSLRASIRNIAAEDVAITLGQEQVTILGTDGMLDDTFADVPALFASWCDKAVDAAIETSGLPPAIVSSATFQLAYSTSDAASQLVRDLKANATTLLFSSRDTDSTLPESTDSLVSTSIIRRALAAVGNPSPNGHVNLLLATGRTFTRHLAEAGHFPVAHEWVYPPTPRHPHKRHRLLDGQRFKVDDSVSQPGEDTECLCLAAPVFEAN